MTTSEWLRSKIGPSPNPVPAERLSRSVDPRGEFLYGYLRPDMHVLHANCGDGGATLGLASFLPLGEVVGVDPDSSKLRRARSRSYVPDGGEISFERCSVNSLPFGPEQFDAVLLDGALATDESPERALEEVKRVLAPGGLLGARHTVASSRVMTGDVPLVERALTRRDTVLRDLGGDPDMGLRQMSLLREAGYVNLRVTSGTEQSTDDELLAELTAGGFVPRIDDSEESDPASDVDEAPVVFSFLTVVETVCWKPA